MTRLTLSLLGSFRAELDGDPITDFESSQVRGLLAYLAVESERSHPRETLAGLLWPDWPERSARSNLRYALSNLRQAIGDREAERPFLHISRSTLQFNVDADVTLDVADFERLSARALSSGEADANRLKQAVALCRGPFLDGLSVADAEPFEAWARSTREYLSQRLSVAYGVLTTALEEQGDLVEARDYARQWIEVDLVNEDAHRCLMRVLTYEGDRTAALAQYDVCCRVLQEELDVAPSQETVALYEAIRDERLSKGLSAAELAEAPAPGDPPYKGLQHFGVGDADLFHGREALTETLVEHLGCEPFLAVIGASGSGKSSLVRAGLIPALRDGAGFARQIHLITPTARPLMSLAASLTRDAESISQTTRLRDDLMTDPRALLAAGQKKCAASGATRSGLLLVIDQFEELFTLCRDEAARRAFVENLVHAAVGSSSGLVVTVAVLRADFYVHCGRYDGLRDLLARHQVYIGPMGIDELRQAIEVPAQQGNWAFEPGLVDLMLRDVGQEPGALPLLSHALLETWRRRRGRTMALGGYDDAGGVRGAIAKTAESVYRGLGADQQAVARSICMRLTELGEGTEDTRRRASLSEVMSIPASSVDVETVLHTLADARLITVAQNDVQVAHEALIREWPTLRGWLEEDREGLRVHRHLMESAQEWTRLGRESGELYRGARLAQAAEWAREHSAQPNHLERAFLQASEAEARRREMELEAQRQRELAAVQELAEAQERRAEERGRLLRWLAVASGFLLIAAIVAVLMGAQARRTALENETLAEDNAQIAATAVAARELEAEQRAVAEEAQQEESRQRAAAEEAQQEESRQRAAAEEAQQEEARQRTAAVEAQTREAEQRAAAEAAEEEALRQKREAQVAYLATSSGQLAEDQYDLALLLSAEAYRMVDNAQSRSGLLTAIEANPSFAGFLHGRVGGVECVALSSDGTTLAAAGSDRATIELWDAVTRAPIRDPLVGHTHPADALAFSPDGMTLASGACAAGGDDDLCVEGELILWDLATGEGTRLPVAHHRQVAGLAFAPDGQTFASVGDDTVVLWDTATREVVRRLAGHQWAVDAVAFSPDGSLLATGGCETWRPEGDLLRCTRADVILWNVETGEVRDRVTWSERPVKTLAFSSDGNLLGVGGCDTLEVSPDERHWDCSNGRIQIYGVADLAPTLPAITSNQDNVLGLAFVNNDAWLLSTSSDSAIDLWDVSTGERVVPAVMDSFAINASAASPDAGILATAGGYTEDDIHLWDLAKIGETNRLRIASPWVTSPTLIAMAVSPDETIIAMAGFERAIQRYDLATAAPVGAPMLGHTDSIWSLAYSPDGRVLASASSDQTVRVWDAQTGEALSAALEGHTGKVNDVAFSPDGTLLASSSDDTTVRLWDTSTWQPLGSDQGILAEHTTPVFDIAFSPDGSVLATTSLTPDRRIILWDLSDPAEPQIMAVLPTNATTGSTQVTFSPDGRTLAVGLGNGSVQLWDLETRELIHAPVPAHTGLVWPARFSPDGSILASGGMDSVLRLTDVASGRLIGPPLAVHEQAALGVFSDLRFLSEGKTLLSSDFTGHVRRWIIDPAVWYEEACAIAGRNLTLGEWAQYLPGETYRVTCPQWSAGE